MWPWPVKTAVWGSGDRTRRQKPRPSVTDIHTYKRKPNAIHDYLPRAKALGNYHMILKTPDKQRSTLTVLCFTTILRLHYKFIV